MGYTTGIGTKRQDSDEDTHNQIPITIYNYKTGNWV